ncbi:uncharacterized protein ZBAI_09891 [Zygosaccharomyces bailii ISA1307]|nr:uncharacterized protein ZBAI_09891 [Zygosaccharomyces bailii ISA1307]
MLSSNILLLLCTVCIKAAGALETRSGVPCSGITPQCPDLNFSWHAQNTEIMQYTMNLLSVLWAESNIYEITVRIQGAKEIDLKYLWSLKVIGIDGPQGTHQLFGKNENVYLIDDPTDFTATFQVYGQAFESDDCKIQILLSGSV